MSEMSMVERVARAVRAVPDAPGWTYSERVARVAIAAMMEPTCCAVCGATVWPQTSTAALQDPA